MKDLIAKGEIMTLERENMEQCSKPPENLIQLSKPPRHPKQYRKASVTKSLSPSASFMSLANKPLASLSISQELVPSFCENKSELFLSFPNLSRKKSIQPSNETGSPNAHSSPFKSFKINSPKKESHVQNSKEKQQAHNYTPVHFGLPIKNDIIPIKNISQVVDIEIKEQCSSSSSCLTKDENALNSSDLEFITPLLSDIESPPEMCKPLLGSSNDNHGLLIFPHPKESQARSKARLVPKNSLDLMDLSSEDEKSTGSTQTLSTLPSVTSPTQSCANEMIHNLELTSSITEDVSNEKPKSTYSKTAQNKEISTSQIILSAKLLQARLSLTGLSPAHLMTSEENLQNCTAPYTPLLTPDLKFDLYEPDPRRPSLIERFSPPIIPPGFPSITPDDLTPEELHEFAMKWGSPHHARGRKAHSRPTLLALPSNRPRVTSLPNRKQDRDEEEDECYRLRHFSITGRGVINRGDSFRSRRCKSNNSVASDVSSNEGWAWSHPCSLATSAASSAASSRASSASESAFPFRVVMLGAAGVGKTTLCHQFMTSEHINGYDSSLDDEYGEKSVSIMLDGEESEIQLIDHPADEMSVENYLATYNPHAIVVVFSVVDRQSFVRAEEIIQYLWRLDVMSHKGVILVANKTDLVRSRCIPLKECSNLADTYDCKFIETSSGLNHRVDELLVGVVKQIRLKIHNPDLSREVFRKRSTRRKKYRGNKTSTSLKVKSLLTKVCGKDIKSKSCENLHVL